MTLAELLQTRAIDRALILDDGYDVVPKAADLATGTDAWANFIADLALHADTIAEAYPGYDDIAAEDLVSSDAFVEALWNVRDKLAGNAREELFGQYERDEASDSTFLAALEGRLGAFGITVARAGRTTAIEDPQVPLIFVDLFLGGTQDAASMQELIARIKAILVGREANPPLVVLMSRSERLDMNKDAFRRDTTLLGAMFRVSAKRALLDEDTLARILTRLAQHRDDGQKLATLLHAWDESLESARQRFMEKIRKLDLPDYAQIRDLLLAFEGQPLGSYLFDVFDRVLQFEIEADRPTIGAARDVSGVDLSRYLAPNIAGSPDLQELVHQTIYHHPERLRVATGQPGLPLAFGDLVAEVAAIDGHEDLAGSRVFAVMTPACDLVRAGCRQVLLLAGTLRALKPSEWTYTGDGVRTPIVILPGDRRYWIAWDLKDLCMWTVGEVAQKLQPLGPYRPFLRLRDGMALELQQRMLADLGRVGQIAPMPATFPIGVEVHRVDAEGQWSRVLLEILDRDSGVCFVGRDEDSRPNLRLVLSEAVCDEIAALIATISEDDVPADARVALGRLKGASDLAERLENGLDVTAAKASYSAIKTARTDGEHTHHDPVAFLARNPSSAPNRQAQRSGVLAFILRDLPDATPPGLAATAMATELPFEQPLPGEDAPLT